MTDNREILLEVKNLKTSFFTQAGEVKAVDDVSYYVKRGEVIAVVGESGCGKSVTQMSVMQLIQTPPGKIVGGEVFFEGKDILKYDRFSEEMRAIRGGGIAMIFQEPMTSLNPVYKIGNQLSEVIMCHKGLDKKAAWAEGVKALAAVGIPDPEARMENYPFQMSGGMRQRVLIAIAVACGSKLIIADEPTTALDVTTQAQVMDLLKSLVKEYGTSILMVTHNLGLVTRYAERVYVMYAGKVIESGTCEDILMHARHPYTMGLLNSVPRLDSERSQDLVAIDGQPPRLSELPPYCSFFPRCPYACEDCKQGKPELQEIGPNDHYAACWRIEEILKNAEK
ncbi:MAG: ABC transporter ATP-binding protein [Spirochaetales bacterium]|nr:ABC transporter ATP-binding protein [Spirochaetales bacterium]